VGDLDPAVDERDDGRDGVRPGRVIGHGVGRGQRTDLRAAIVGPDAVDEGGVGVRRAATDIAGMPERHRRDGGLGVVVKEIFPSWPHTRGRPAAESDRGASAAGCGEKLTKICQEYGKKPGEERTLPGAGVIDFPGSRRSGTR